jgi:sialate O-acetylesterase
MKHPLIVNSFVPALLALASGNALAEVRMSNLFSDHMVLQRDQPVSIWGWADGGEKITGNFQGQSVTTTTTAEGDWKATLQPLKTAMVGADLQVQGKNTVTVADVLVGEVWICSGQSNMEWTVGASVGADLEKLTAARHKTLRLLTVRTPGQQEPVKQPEQKWVLSDGESVLRFSAVGYYFGEQLSDTLNVPIGLIDNSWGGSACEAWVRRDILESDAAYTPLMQKWAGIEKSYDHDQAVQKYKTETLPKWEAAVEKAKAEGKTAPQKPRAPQNQLTGNQRPGNLYNGRLKPVLGYGIRGAIWYQGESNASRAYQYRDLFPKMINCWRKDWNQGDFPFYWVQLADYKAEVEQPGDSDWAELREAQTRTLSLPNTGEAVIVDLGEANDIHPRRKMEVGLRLARHALAKNYNIAIPCQAPLYDKMEQKGDGKILVTFKEVGAGLATLDINDVVGFAIAGEDKTWKKAAARLVGPNQVEVHSMDVAKPVAVRYAWADNPVCNLFGKNDLPVTPFRTDDWPGVTANNNQ